MSMATRTNTQSPALHVGDSHDLIRVQGARENNLKDVSVEIPKRRLTISARPRRRRTGCCFPSGCRVKVLAGLAPTWRLGVAAAGRAAWGSFQALAAAVRWLWILSRLCVAAANRHSERTADLPRRWKRSIPRLNLSCPNTGSTVAWRFR